MGAWILVVLTVASCGDGSDGERTEAPWGSAAGSAAGTAPRASPASTPTPLWGMAGAGTTDELPPLAPGDELEAETERDWAIARRSVEWARDQALEQLPIGEVVAMIGSSFLGAPYEPGTLEVPGEERLVVNLRAFDCVTLVEHLLVLARLVVDVDDVTLADEERFRDRYRAELTAIRYRDGVVDGYPSRLHYFSEWIGDGERKGLVRDVTAELGGVPDERPIGFMSANPEAYRQLVEDPANLEAIRAIEARISAESRRYIPQDRIEEVEDGIRNGDVIAAVSTIDGLDIAHTGIALRHAGRLHLLHAPLVGETVELSATPLGERVRGIEGQMGIMVARPLSPGSGVAAAHLLAPGTGVTRSLPHGRDSSGFPQ